MPRARVPVAIEVGQKRTFVWGVDWPGWCRSGKGDEGAMEALLAAAPRYAEVARQAGLRFPSVAIGDLQVVSSVPGSSGTDFGVPSMVIDADRRAVRADEAEGLVGLVKASWEVFDRISAAAPEELRKGPRGGGRDTTKIIAHVNEADHAYAREMGLRLSPPHDRPGVEAIRAAMLEVLHRTSDGSPLAERRWPPRYAARRIAWHALDHAWEIEDRSPS
jgi:hypothetical protein